MKILIFSDLHLHNWQYGSTLVNGMNSRLLDGANVLNQIAEYCKTNPIDYVVFGGDLFHTHGKIDAAVLKVAWEGIRNIIKHTGEMFLLVGNHDTSDKSMAVHAMHWLESFDQCTVIHKPTHNHLFSALPYTEDITVLKDFFRDAGQICFTHQGMAGVPIGSGFLINEIMTPSMIPSTIKHLFTGHYHKHTLVSDHVTVIGSTMQLTWADEGDKRGFLVYDTATGSIEQIESIAPKFVTVDWDALTDIGPCENNFVRVINYARYNQEATRVDIMESGARSVEFIQNKEEHTIMLKPLTTCNGFHLPTLVAEYEQQKSVTPECSKIGKELMQ